MAGYPQRLPDGPAVHMLKYSEQYRAAYKEETPTPCPKWIEVQTLLSTTRCRGSGAEPQHVQMQAFCTRLVNALQPALQGSPMMQRSGSSGDGNLRIFERGDAAGNIFRWSPALCALPRASGACKKSQRRRRRERRRGSTTRHVSLFCSRTAKKGKGSTKTLG